MEFTINCLKNIYDKRRTKGCFLKILSLTEHFLNFQLIHRTLKKVFVRLRALNAGVSYVPTYLIYLRTADLCIVNACVHFCFTCLRYFLFYLPAWMFVFVFYVTIGLSALFNFCANAVKSKVRCIKPGFTTDNYAIKKAIYLYLKQHVFEDSA